MVGSIVHHDAVAAADMAGSDPSPVPHSYELDDMISAEHTVGPPLQDSAVLAAAAVDCGQLDGLQHGDCVAGAAAWGGEGRNAAVVTD